MRCLLVVFAMVVGVSCSGPPPEAKKAVVATVVMPSDEAGRFPEPGLVKMEVVPSHLLGKAFMPGGNLADYRVKKAEYQQFLGKLADAQTAAFLLLDWKKQLKDAHYLAHMGGFYGMDGDRPVYVFTKGVWVAGVVGLPEAKADVIAREFAVKF